MAELWWWSIVHKCLTLYHTPWFINSLKEQGVIPYTTSIISMTYVDATTMFQDGTCIKIGVKWFDSMSPSLFSVAINLVLQHLQLFAGEITIDNNHWNAPAFASDTALVSNTVDQMQHIIWIPECSLNEIDLQILVTKCASFLVINIWLGSKRSTSVWECSYSVHWT